MSYYVVDSNGARFGPADLATLNRWSLQGRIAPDTVLEDSATGDSILATSLPGLILPLAKTPPLFSSQVTPNPTAIHAGPIQGKISPPTPSAPLVIPGSNYRPQNDPLGGGKASIWVSVACGFISLLTGLSGAFFSFVIAGWGLISAWNVWKRNPALGAALIAFNVLCVLFTVYMGWHRFDAGYYRPAPHP